MTFPLSGRRLLVVSEDAELARLVAAVTIRLGARVQAVASGRAAVEALGSGGHDAALLDLPLGDAGAAELLAACGRAGAVAVVVSGVYRGPQARHALVRLGAREVLEKPFQIEALARSLARPASAAPPPVVYGNPGEVTGAAPLRATEERSALSAPPVPALDPPPPARGPAPREGFSVPLPGAAPTRAGEPEAPPPQPRGELAKAGVARVLVALHLGQATGALTLARGPIRKVVVVERGAPVCAASNVPAERFGALCVRRGLVTPGRLEAILRAAPGARSGEALVAAGVLTAAQRTELLGGQLRAIAWSTFEWRDGSYAFELGRPPAGRVPLRLDPGDLVLEGIRRIATLPRLREELPAALHLAPAPDPAFELHALRLLEPEARLLVLADGTKSVADLLRLSDLPERDTLAFLLACRALRVLDQVERVLASTRRIGFM